MRKCQYKIYMASVKIFNRSRNEKEPDSDPLDSRRVGLPIVDFK